MELRKKFLKALAFVPAIALVGGFIGCRTGAFQMFSKPETPPEAAPPQPPAPPDTPPASESKPSVFFSGSKSPNLPGVTSGLSPAGGQQVTPSKP